MAGQKPLTDKDKYRGFRRAVTSFSGAAERWQERASTGMTNADLHEALRQELGIAGGSGGRDSLRVSYEGSGLKVWVSWMSHNTYIDEPTFQGEQSARIAREIFNISDPDDNQLDLFTP